MLELIIPYGNITELFPSQHTHMHRIQRTDKQDHSLTSTVFIYYYWTVSQIENMPICLQSDCKVIAYEYAK